MLPVPILFAPPAQVIVEFLDGIRFSEGGEEVPLHEPGQILNLALLVGLRDVKERSPIPKARP